MYKREYIDFNGFPYYEYYYTIKDLVTLVGADTKLFASTSLATIVTNHFSDLVGDGYYKNGTYADKIWQRILAKYETNYIYVSPFELNVTTYREQIFNGFKKIIVKMEDTSFKYNALLSKLYNANTDLFGKIKSKTTNSGLNKFNDTPQDIDTSLDGYLSNMTSTSNQMDSETDGENIVNRIREYMDRFSHILDDWTKEFNELFIESLNVN